MRYYPICLDLRGRPCVVVGGGRVAERKVKTLLRAGASVSVISPEVTKGLAALAARKKINLTLRPYDGKDLGPMGTSRNRGCREAAPLLVFAATNHPEVQHAIQRDSEAIGALFNAADDANKSDFIVPASFSRGDLLIAVSTSGSSPALARRLRAELQLKLGPEYTDYLRNLREARKQVRAEVTDPARRAEILRQLSEADGMEWFRRSSTQRPAQDARNRVSELIARSAKTK
jgi:precorrin-2 dehydrogenase/sirohydrochlorin ferrochelatase